jgi:hypothetical protein
MSRHQTIEELLTQYVSDPSNKELEVRLKYCDYIDTLKKIDTMTTTHTIFLESVKYGDNSKIAIRMLYNPKTNTITKTAYKKKRLFYYTADMYSVNISEELDDNVTNLVYLPDKLIFKNRFSYPHLLAKEWRVDVTIDMMLDNMNSITRLCYEIL